MSAGHDQALVERVQQGDKHAFDLLVKKYQHKVFSLISRLIRDPADIADVAQEAFIKAYRALPNFRGESAFYTWMYRIAINTAKNHLVASGRRPPDSDIDASDAEQYANGDALRDLGSPERLALRDELKQRVFESIEGLPEELRAAITLREMEGMSYEEIADVLECPVGTVRSRIFRARETIDRNIRELL
ncbi:RNA polymerase sigma factor RpoE [Pleionea litopenaei]|uniref:RNA polymerase sigma factor RpoE n=1 Tax=Pleionea litopenaei TaxID=3070815 RepID=A0AA51RVY0_9GAMM|nr:RNA polymerase sigma factor RpoE [Pleionea sp. HL-JVS1]WMS88592.1 RNA polymerase sigma factor RpoE [Pleionea sp. HL-JVS1]